MIRQIRKRLASDESGFTLIETLVSAVLLGLLVAGLTSLYIHTSKVAVATVTSSGATQANRDTLGYLVSAPINVIDAVATKDSHVWAPAPDSLPGVKPMYATSIQVLTNLSNPKLYGSNIEVQAQTCYTPRAETTPLCVTGSVVRPGIDLANTPPTTLNTAAVNCDGNYTVDNKCTPVLATSLTRDGAGVVATITEPKPGKSGAPVAATLQRSLTSDFQTPSTIDTSTLANPRGALTDTGADLPSHSLADSAVDTKYYYRAGYTVNGAPTIWSSTAAIVVPASHLPCSTTKPVPAASACTPIITLGQAVASGTPAAPSLDVPITLTGPQDSVTYMIEKVASTTCDPTSPLLSSPALVDACYAKGARLTKVSAGPAVTMTDTLVRATTDVTWYYRVSYGTDANGVTIWSQPVPFTVPAK